MRVTFFVLTLVITSSAIAKEERQYLYRTYADAEAVARVAVINQRELDANHIEYELKVLKSIKGLAGEKTLKVTLGKSLPVEASHLTEGEVGMAFLQKEKVTNRFRLTRFIPAEDFTTNTSMYLCMSPDEPCSFTKFSEVEDFFRKR